MYIPDLEGKFTAGHKGVAHFEDGQLDYEIEVHPAGELTLPSGNLVACDPFTSLSFADPFTVALPPGKYPVTLSVAHFPQHGDRRVAYARIDLKPSDPIHELEMAVLPDDDVAGIADDGYVGFGVDAGTGCFADALVVADLDDEETFGEFTELLEEKLDGSHQDTWDWANIEVGDSNVVAFHSGFGDGSYPTYFCRNEAGEIISVVTDLMVLPPPPSDAPAESEG